MKMVDNLEDQLLEEKARLMSMLEYISRSDLEPEPRPQLGFLVFNKSPSLGRTSPSPPAEDEGGDKLRRPSQTYASLIREVHRAYVVDFRLQIIF